MVVKQVSDRYAGEIIGERYQVMANCIGSTFYIADLVAPDILVRVDGRGSDTKRFTSVEDAEAFIRFTLLGEKFTNDDHATGAEDTKEICMAKNARAAAVKAADKRLDEKPKAKRARMTPVLPAVKNRPGRGPRTSGTVAATCRALIAEGKMGDDQMLAAVRASFPDKKIASNAISYYREH